MENDTFRRYKETNPEPESGYDTEWQSGEEIAGSLTSYEDYGLDPGTRSEIAAMPFDEAFETAYGYLTQAGLDADEILSHFMS